MMENNKSMSQILRAGMTVAVQAPDPEELDKEAREVLLAEVGQFTAPDAEAGTWEPTAADKATLDRMLNKLKALQSEMAEVDEIAAYRKKDIELWADGAKIRLARQLFYLEQDLLAAANTVRFSGKRKSLALPHGVLGRRSKGDKLAVVDKDEALKFSKEMGIPYKRVEEPYVGELKDFWNSTGELPPGCEVIEGGDEPYIS